MSWINCSIQGCHVSRRSKHKCISVLKNSDFEINWRNKFVVIVTTDRVVDANFEERINNKRIFICQQHFRTYQYHVHDPCKTLIPGEILELNLPVKSTSTEPKLRPAKSITMKKQINSLSLTMKTRVSKTN